jgi:hypothetical protein
MPMGDLALLAQVRLTSDRVSKPIGQPFEHFF